MRDSSAGHPEDDYDQHLRVGPALEGGEVVSSSSRPRGGKKRNARRAGAQSQQNRESEWKRIQEKQQERIKKMQRDAERAMFPGADGESAQMRQLEKKKKKKQKKEWIRKEVNYWLDYDSPYAEYLVARFREWSPQVRLPSRGVGQK